MPQPPWSIIVPLLAALTQVAVAQVVHHVGPGNHPTIQAAITVAAPGEIIEVAAGVYPSFHVGKALTIAAEPSALVQIISTGPLTVTLQPFDRVFLGGLDIQVSAITITGGIVAAERCTVHTDTGMQLVNGVALLRWCAAGAAAASGILVQDGHLYASDSTFSTTAGGANDFEYGAVHCRGVGTCNLALCSLIGAWPATPAAPWPSAALHVTEANVVERVWVVDCTLNGGLLSNGMEGPSVTAPALPTLPPVRIYRSQLTGPAFGAISFGRILGVHTPVDMAIGSTFTTTMHGEPGHPFLFYVGTDVFGPVQIPEVDQPAFGFINTLIFPIVYADSLGNAQFSFPVPNIPTLRHFPLWWRGLDLISVPWQATPPFVTIIQ